MTNRYRISGTVTHSFVLRGMCYAVGVRLDQSFDSADVAFVRSHCKVDRVTCITENPEENSISTVEKTTKKKTEKSVVSKDENRRSSKNGERDDT